MQCSLSLVCSVSLPHSPSGCSLIAGVNQMRSFCCSLNKCLYTTLLPLNTTHTSLKTWPCVWMWKTGSSQLCVCVWSVVLCVSWICMSVCTVYMLKSCSFELRIALVVCVCVCVCVCSSWINWCFQATQYVVVLAVKRNKPLLCFLFTQSIVQQ